MGWNAIDIDDVIEVNYARNPDVKCAYSSSRLLPTEKTVCLDQYKEYDFEKDDPCFGKCSQMMFSGVYRVYTVYCIVYRHMKIKFD